VKRPAVAGLFLSELRAIQYHPPAGQLLRRGDEDLLPVVKRRGLRAFRLNVALNLFHVSGESVGESHPAALEKARCVSLLAMLFKKLRALRLGHAKNDPSSTTSKLLSRR